MSPEDILARMRDIQMPDAEAASAPAMFAPQPFWVLGAVILLVAFLRWRRRNGWRRMALARLDAIAADADDPRQWQNLTALRRRIARHTRTAPPPDCVFLPPERIGPEQLADLTEDIRKAIAA